MTARDAVPDEMPEFSLSGRAGLELDDQLLDAILSGQLSPEAPGQATVVAEMLASLADPVYSGHLAGEEAARSAFARAVSPAPGRHARHARPEPAAAPGRSPLSWRPGRLTMRLAAGLAAATVGLSGTVAAYAGALPAPVQNLAHFAIGAPPPPPPPRSRHRPARPATAPGRSSAPAGTATSPAVTGQGRARGKGRSQGEHRARARGRDQGKSEGKAKGKGRGHSALPPGQARKNSHAGKTAHRSKSSARPISRTSTSPITTVLVKASAAARSRGAAYRGRRPGRCAAFTRPPF